MSGGKLTVSGLGEFQTAVKRMQAGLPKAERDALGVIMGEVVDYARPRMPRKTGRAAASLKGKVSARSAYVTEGGPSAPWAPWLDFGGEGKRKGRPPKRPFLKEGRYVYKALSVKRADIDDILSEAVTTLATDAGLEVT